MGTSARIEAADQNLAGFWVDLCDVGHSWRLVVLVCREGSPIRSASSFSQFVQPDRSASPFSQAVQPSQFRLPLQALNYIPAKGIGASKSPQFREPLHQSPS